MKIKIDIPEILYLAGRMRTINALDIDDIEFTIDGHPINIGSEVVEKFKLTGLANTDFILTNYYLKKGE